MGKEHSGARQFGKAYNLVIADILNNPLYGQKRRTRERKALAYCIIKGECGRHPAEEEARVNRQGGKFEGYQCTWRNLPDLRSRRFRIHENTARRWLLEMKRGRLLSRRVLDLPGHGEHRAWIVWDEPWSDLPGSPRIGESDESGTGVELVPLGVNVTEP